MRAGGTQVAAPERLYSPDLNSDPAPVQLPRPHPARRTLPSSFPVKRARGAGAVRRPGWSGGGNPNTGRLLGRGQRGNGARRPGPVGSICSSQDFAFVQSEILRD